MSTLVENVQKVVAAHAALKEAIAAKGVAVPDGTKLSAMPALVGQIETPPDMTDGNSFYKKSGRDSIDAPAVVFIDFTATRILTSCFRGCSALTSLTLPAGFGKVATNIISCFSGCSALTSLTLPAGFGQHAKSAESCFFGCSALTSLTLPTGFGQAISLYVHTRNMFSGCSALTNITGNPNFNCSLDLSSCANLTHDSLMVVINGLKTVTTTQTLKLGETNKAKLSEDEIAVATAKGWTIA